jgi:hypothetical protein
MRSSKDDRGAVMGGLLAIAGAHYGAKRSPLGESVANLAFGATNLGPMAHSAIRACVVFGPKPRLTGTASLGIYTFLYAFTRARTDAEAFRERTAIRALGNLKLEGSATTDVLLRAVNDPFQCDVAAKALSIIGPVTDDVVMVLLESARRHASGETGTEVSWSKTAGEILVALGMLGQRSSSVVDLLLGIVNKPKLGRDWDWKRYAVTYALCQAAETSADAMAFILGSENRLREAETSSGRFTEELEEEIRDGLNNGEELIKEVSETVIRCLFDHLQDPSYPTRKAGGLLSHISGDSPLVRCREVAADGGIRYVPKDLSEEAFGAFLKLPDPRASFGGCSALQLLVRWGLSRPELTARVIELVRDAEPWLYALQLESCLHCPPHPDQTLTPAFRAQVKQAAARLRSADEAVRNAEIAALVATGRLSPEELLASKRQLLGVAYSLAVLAIWQVHYDNWSQRAVEQASPHVIAALACFKGWDNSYFNRLPLTTEETRNEFRSQVERALAILRQPSDQQTVALLSSIVKAELVQLSDSELHQALTTQDNKPWKDPLHQWHEHTRLSHSPIEQTAAWYVLAQLASDHPEVQSAMLMNLEAYLKPQDQSEIDDSSPAVDVIRAFGYVRHASRDLMNRLLELAVYPNEHVQRAATLAISWLESPEPTAVELLVERYGQIRLWRQDRLIKALRKVDSPDAQVINLFLTALDDEDHEVAAAAVALSEIKMPDSETEAQVADALARCVERSPAATRAVGKLAAQMMPPGAPGSRKRSDHEERLKAIARRLRIFMRRNEWSDAVNLGYEALHGIATKLTELEVETSTPDQSMLRQGDFMLRPTASAGS